VNSFRPTLEALENREVMANTISLTAAYANLYATVGQPFDLSKQGILVSDTDPNARQLTFAVSWGDGSSSTFQAWYLQIGAVEPIHLVNSTDATHTYSSPSPWTSNWYLQITSIRDNDGNTANIPAGPNNFPYSYLLVVDPPLPQSAPPAPAAPSPQSAPLRMGVFAEVLKVKGKYEVEVFDAATGALLFTLSPFPKSARQPQVQVRDVNGDGVPDWLITAQQGKHTLSVALDGTDGTPLF
jgi:hypothetical protein